MIIQIQKALLNRTKALRYIGCISFLLAFIWPTRGFYGADYHFFAGCGVFVKVLFLPFMHPPDYFPEAGWPPFGQLFQRSLLCVLCWGSWIANFTIFFRLPLLVVLFIMVAPCAAFPLFFPFMVSFIPFYLWIFGIALIHLSPLQGQWPKTLREATSFKAPRSSCSIRPKCRVMGAVFLYDNRSIQI